MADDEKKRGYGVGAFASSVHSQQKYIVFNLDEVTYDTDYGMKGAERYLPAVASHELFHALGFYHPRTDAAEGEKANTRGWQKIKEDIAPWLSSTTALGTLNTTTGVRTITYSFGANPTQVPHGRQQTYNQMLYGDDMQVEGMTNLTDTKNAERNKLHVSIKSAMMEAFAEHESLFNVKFVEASDPGKANLLLYAGVIPRTPTRSADQVRGSNAAYTHDVTILSYNRVEGDLFPMSGVGDAWVGQQVYGKPAKRDERLVIGDERLVAKSGVLWDHKPIAIRLTASPMVGKLNVDLSAHPYQPAIAGKLKDAEGLKCVRQHIGAGASIGEFDASGSGIELNIAGAENTRIKVGSSSCVTLNCCNNDVTLGPGCDEITHSKGFGHRLSGLGDGDVICAKDARHASIQEWNVEGYDKGSLVTLWGDSDKACGSIFIRDMKPDDIKPYLKDLNVIDTPNAPALTVQHTVDMDTFMETAPPVISFRDARDVMISARQAAWHGITNMGSGEVIIRMTARHHQYG